MRDLGPQAGEYFIAPGTGGLTPEQRAATLNGAYTRTSYTANTLALAPFAQGTWHILSSLDFTAGLRYTYERKWGDYEADRYSRTDISGFNDAQIELYNSYTPTVPYYKLSKSWGNFSGLATLSQKLGEDKLVFITYSRGSKSGGINLANLPKDEHGQTRTDLAYPVSLVNARIGLKGTSGKWEALIWSQNLFDSLYFLTKSVDEQTGLVSGLLGAPGRSAAPCATISIDMDAVARRPCSRHRALPHSTTAPIRCRQLRSLRTMAHQLKSVSGSLLGSILYREAGVRRERGG